MIGRILTRQELDLIFAHAARLIRLNYKADVSACLEDPEFASLEPGFQEIVASDMQFLLGASGESTLQ